MLETVKNLSMWDIPQSLSSLYAYILQGKTAHAELNEIISENVSGNSIVFKASGLLDSILPMKDYSGDLIYFDKGDADRLFVKRSPELLMSFSNFDSIDQIIDDWSCACFENRVMYFTDKKHLDSLIDYLGTRKFSTSTDIANVWDMVNMIVANSPEAPDHNTFLLILKKELSPASNLVWKIESYHG